MQNNTVETLVGAIVVIVAAAFLFFAYTTTGSGSVSGYDVKARFAAADGVASGTDVRLHGIKIGTVTGLVLDPKTYQAVADLSIQNGILLPDDSSIRITSSGLLGSSYLAVQPGGSDKMLHSGGEITNTQGSVDFISLIARAMYGNTGSK